MLISVFTANLMEEYSFAFVQLCFLFVLLKKITVKNKD